MCVVWVVWVRVGTCGLCGYVWVVSGVQIGWEERTRSFLAEHYDCMGGSMYIRTDFSWLQSNP